MQLHGIHHLTAVSAGIRENLQFYTRMRFTFIRCTETAPTPSFT